MSSHRPLSRRLDRCDRVIHNESGDNMCSFSGATCTSRDVTMQITFLTRKSALIYRRELRQRVASLTLNCNVVLAIRAYNAPPCLFCKKKTQKKTITMARTFQACETIVQTATVKGKEDILRVTGAVNNDLVAAEARYHKACHATYR